MTNRQSSPLEADRRAERRAREAYRYFQPTNPAALNSTYRRTDEKPVVSAPPSTLLPVVVAPLDEKILSSPNTTLNAFAQLAALRLNAKRVLISILDRESQFILAEATQSLNLNNSKLFNGDNDGLWAGCSTVGESWSVCKDTVTLRRDKEFGHSQFLIVNDLAEHPRYKRLPFVTEEPCFRFYAGTPLTTGNHVNIGCIFVLDTDCRDGLTDIEKDHLGTVASLVMDYLLVSRQADEGRRAARLSRGLSCFVDGSSSFIDMSDPSRSSSSPPGSTAPALSTTPSSINPRSSPSATSRVSTRSATSRRSRMSRSSRQGSVDADLGSSRSQSGDDGSVGSGSEGKLDTGTSSDLTTPLADWCTDRNGKGLPLDDINSNSWAFRRAANLLRESLEVDSEGGVIFVEASNSPVLDGDNNNFYTTETDNPAPVLAISTYDEPFAPQPGSHASCPAANLNRAFLQQLLRRYPKGKLWSFHRDGSVATSDEEEKSTHKVASKPIGVTRPSSTLWRTTENSMLGRYFPHANQVMFVPLWNPINSQWYAGCFCWTTLETHIFSTSVELSSVLGFASSVMAECSRVESLIADRQKGDFIGSISHELRSPLHGILAAAEFLDGTSLSEFQESLLETINACGRTLLDTMNQVLDFSKIMSLERSWRQMKRNKETPPADFKSIDKNPAHLDSYVWTDLAILAEEVVEGVCLGHSYGQKASTSDHSVFPARAARQSGSVHSGCRPSNDVEVVLDIVHQDWIYKTQPGALRRIIMNVFGNAMKYTERGRVAIRLDAVERSEGRSRRQGLQDLVTLTISDTGRGISEEFLRGKLYTPFAQEDTLAVGTGLGLSIVRSIVKALNGSISIHSRPGEGTIVKVSLPLTRPAGEENPLLTPHPELLEQRDISIHVLQLREAFAGTRVSILAFDPVDPDRSPFWSVVAQYLMDWYELKLVPWPAQEPIDLLLADESHLASDSTKGTLPLVPALLIFCNKAIDYSSARSEWSSLATTVDIVRRPCGPHKLAKTILKFLGGSNSSSSSRFASPGYQTVVSYRTKTQSKSTSGVIENLSEERSASDSSLTFQSSPETSNTPQSAVTAATSVSPPTPRVSPNMARKPRVLVVDDNSINLNLMLTFMKKRDLAALDSAENGQLAVDAVERMEQGYDLIFMDMSMPVMDGFEATRAIRSIEKERDGYEPALIVALTGLSSSRDESEALASGVDLFLTKPVSFKEVSKLLNEWEGRHQNLSEGSQDGSIPSTLPLPSPEEDSPLHSS